MRVAPLLAPLVLAACRASAPDAALLPPMLPTGAEALSLSGRPLHPPAIPSEELERREQALALARERWASAPLDLEALLWVGRRLGYLHRYREALQVFSQGTREHPADPRPWRFRGHCYITVREFASAERDLARASELIAGTPDSVEPSGLPNERGIDLDTLHHSVWYHLGLARYLEGEFERALPAYRRCREVSANPDALCAASYWLYLTLLRAGREDEARAVLEPIRPDLDVIEYGTYHRLLLAYRGEREPDELYEETRARAAASTDQTTIGYGVAAWHLAHGRSARALEILRQVLDNPNWNAFGYIAAEAELQRLGPAPATSSP